MKSTKQYLILVAVVVSVLLTGCTEPAAIDFQSQTTNAATPWTSRPFMNNPMNFQFAIVTDPAGGRRPGVFEKAMLQINLLQPEFVMCVGDLIEGGTENREMLQEQYDGMDTVLNSLQMRFFRVAGNHDISNAVMTNVYRNRYGSPYYHFVYKNVLFLIVCTEDPPSGNISDTQASHLRTILQDNKSVRWTLVFMHAPLFVENEGKLHEGWAKIENMLKDRPHNVFAGHWHTYAKHEKHGRSYIHLATTGGSSGLRGIAVGEFDHIMWVTMTDEGPRIANLMLDGIHDENVKVAE